MGFLIHTLIMRNIRIRDTYIRLWLDYRKYFIRCVQNYEFYLRLFVEVALMVTGGRRDVAPADSKAETLCSIQSSIILLLLQIFSTYNEFVIIKLSSERRTTQIKLTGDFVRPVIYLITLRFIWETFNYPIK